MAASAALGGMFFGWVCFLILSALVPCVRKCSYVGHGFNRRNSRVRPTFILKYTTMTNSKNTRMDSFKHSFGLDQGQTAAKLAELNGNIVSVLQGAYSHPMKL